MSEDRPGHCYFRNPAGNKRDNLSATKTVYLSQLACACVLNEMQPKDQEQLIMLKQKGLRMNNTGTLQG